MWRSDLPFERVRSARCPVRSALKGPVSVFLALTGATMLFTEAMAQAPEQRLAIDHLREELAAVTDSVILSRREAAGIEQARADRDNALLHLHLGFVGYRLGEVTGEKRHHDEAAAEFEWATELQPDWPYPWYGLGLAELALGEHGSLAIENLRQMLGKDYLSKSANAFARAARADPSFADAVIDLALTAMRQRRRARLDVALDALRQASATTAGASPALQLARGRLEREAGEGDSALVVFGRYLEAGGDSGVGMMEAARTGFYLNRPGPATIAYYGSAASSSPEAVALHRADLAWIATPAELQAFDGQTGATRAAWLEDFWSRRDLREARRRGERLAEHYRRYFHAFRNYRLVSRHRHYDITERFRSEQGELDDRGVIYLRHGEPDRRATFSERSVEPNESWLYIEPEGNRVFHFVARDDVQDFKLVESLADAYGLRTALAMGAGGSIGSASALFESRSGLDPIYQRMATLQPSARGSALSEERQRGQDAIRKGTTSDTYALRFRERLTPAVKEFAVAGPAGETRLLIPFALPGSQLVPFARGSSVVYPLELRMVAERADGLIRVLDTVRMFSTARRVESREQLSGLMQLDLPPGRYRLRTVIAESQTDVGAVVQRGEVDIPVLGPGARAMSDVLIGRSEDGPFWVERGDSVPLTAAVSFPAGSDLDLYFELHGITTGEPYRTRIVVTREDGGGPFGWFRRKRRPISLEYAGRAIGQPTRVSQTVGVGELPPGRYRMVIQALFGPGDGRHERVLNFAIAPRRAG